MVIKIPCAGKVNRREKDAEIGDRRIEYNSSCGQRQRLISLSVAEGEEEVRLECDLEMKPEMERMVGGERERRRWKTPGTTMY